MKLLDSVIENSEWLGMLGLMLFEAALAALCIAGVVTITAVFLANVAVLAVCGVAAVIAWGMTHGSPVSSDGITMRDSGFGMGPPTTTVTVAGEQPRSFIMQSDQ